MKYRWTAAALALLLTIGASPIAAFAVDVPTIPTDPSAGTPATPNDNIDEGIAVDDPLESLTFDLSKGVVSITGGVVKYAGAVQKPANKYIIKGVQSKSFILQNASVNMDIQTDITAVAGDVKTTGLISIKDGNYINTAKMSYIPTDSKSILPIDFYQVAFAVPDTKVTQKLVVTINDKELVSPYKTVAADGKVHFWLTAGEDYKIKLVNTAPVGAKIRAAAQTYEVVARISPLGTIALELPKEDAPTTPVAPPDTPPSPPTPPPIPIVKDFTSGSGTEADPYRIQSATELAKVQTGDNAGKYYQLNNTFALPSTWSPISFTGKLDGKNFTISLGGQPIFDSIVGGASVKNLSVSGSSQRSGMISNSNAGAIDRVSVSSNVANPGGYAGGVAGTNSGTITNATVSGVVNGAMAGGIAGSNSGSITGATVRGNITGTTAGGVVGTNSSTGSNINNATYSGSVSGTTAGGIVGELGGSITNSNSTGSVVATTNGTAGGIAGRTTGVSAISKSFSNSNVTATGGNAGGLVGYSTANITSSYATGAVSGSNAGGLVGQQAGGVVSGSYATGTVSGTSTAGGITGWKTGDTIQSVYAIGNVNGGSGWAGGIVGKSDNGGFIMNSIALNANIWGATGRAGRISGNAFAEPRSVNVSGNYAAESTRVNNAVPAAGTANGASLTYAQLQTPSTYRSILGSNMGWDYTGSSGLPTSGIPGGQTSVPLPPVAYPPTSGGGGGGGNDNEPPYSETFWEDMKDRIDDASSGDKIKFSTTKLDNMPTSVLKLLKGKNVTLEISHGRDTIKINGKRMYDIPKNRVYYNFDDLADLYANQPASSSKPASSSSTAKPVTPPVAQPIPPVLYPTNPNPAPAPTPTPTPSSSEAESSSSEESSSDVEVIAEESSEPDVPADVEPEAPKKSATPLIVAGIVILLALLGGGAALYFGYYRRRGDE